MRIYLDRVATDKNGLPVATFEVGDEMVAFGVDKTPKSFIDELVPNAIVECEIVDGCIVNPVILYEETKQREEQMKNRLHSLFKRKK